MFNFIKNFIKRNTKTIQLHRWWHPEYTIKCNIERKIDLANYDNSLCIKNIQHIILPNTKYRRI